MKNSQAIAAYQVLASAKLTKMSDSDKFKVIKAMRVFKKVNTEYDDLHKDSTEKLKAENHDEIIAKLQEAAKTAKEGEDPNTVAFASLTAEEQEVLNAHAKAVKDCEQEFLDKELSGDYEKLSEDALGKFLESNPDLNIAQAILAEEALC